MPLPKKKVKLAKCIIFLLCSSAAFCIANVIFNYLALYKEKTQALKAGTAASISEDHFAFRVGYLLKSNLDAPLTVLLALIIGALVSFRLSQHKGHRDLEAEGVKGTARWATRSELLSEDKELKAINIKKLRSEAHTGVPIYRSGNSYIVDTSTTHSLTVGCTRSGKTQSVVFTMMYLFAQCADKQNVVVNDSKGEICEGTYKIFKDNGYSIRILNLRDTSISSGYNPLAVIIDGYKEAMLTDGQELSDVLNDIHSLADAITYDKKSDPIWPSSAKSLLSAIILYLLEACYITNSLDKLSLYTVTTFFVEYGSSSSVDPETGNELNRLDELFRSLPVGHPAKTEYATSNFSSGDTRSSIFTTLSDDLSLWTDEGICRLTSSRELDFNEILTSDKPTAIFMIIPDDRMNRHKLAILFLNQLYQSMITYMSKNKLPQMIRRWNFVLDEFAQMPPIPAMSQKMSVSAGRNIIFHLYIQSLSQLHDKYNDSAEAIQAHCGNFIYIYSMDKNTNNYVSELLSNYTQTYRTYSGKADENSSQQVDSKPLMSPLELRRMKKGETIIIRQRLNPIFARFTYFYKFGFRRISVYDIQPGTKQAEAKKLSAFLPDFQELISAEKTHLMHKTEEANKQKMQDAKKKLTLGELFYVYDHGRNARKKNVPVGNVSNSRNSRDSWNSGNSNSDRTKKSGAFESRNISLPSPSPLTESISAINALSDNAFSEMLASHDFTSAKKLINRYSMQSADFKNQHSDRLYDYVDAHKNSNKYM